MKHSFIPSPASIAFFESRSAPARLPIAEAQRIFAAVHEPPTRAVVTRRGGRLKGASLLDRHQIGTCFQFVRDQQVHAGVFARAEDFFLDRFQLSAGVKSGLFLAADLAAGLDPAWIERNPAALPVAAAAAIGRRQPMLAAWMRRLLYEQGAQLSWLHRSENMAQAVGVLQGHLHGWPPGVRAPSEDDFLDWIDGIRRGRPLPVPACPPDDRRGAARFATDERGAARLATDERRIPREAEEAADEAAVELAQRMELLEHRQAETDRRQAEMAQRHEGAVADCTVLYQLDQVLYQASGQLYRVRAEFGRGAALALDYEQAYGCTGALLEVEAEPPLDPNQVLLGADRPVPALAGLGLDAKGRHMDLSLFVSQLVLAIGGREWGKSHLGRLIAESLHLHLPGANRLPYPLRSATFEVDYNLGQGRRQMLRGFFPNRDAGQLAQLHAYYGSRIDNAALRHGLLRCLPDSLKGLRAELPAYIERGLVIEPLELGPQNLWLRPTFIDAGGESLTL